MTTGGDTQEFPRVAPAPTRVAEAHEVIYERAVGRIAALSATWQEALDGVHAPAPARQPVTVPAGTTAVGDTVEAVIARTEAPRWRRRLAS